MRTAYAFKNAAGTIEDYIERIKVIGWTNAPIIDTASTFGFVAWRDLCKKNELKPVYGIELAVTDMIQKKKPVVDYFQFIAVDSIVPIFELLEKATSQFRYEPLLTYEQMIAAKNVYKIAGYRAQLDLFQPDGFTFVGLSVACSKGYINKAVASGFQLIMRQENRYPVDGMQAIYELVCGRNASLQSYPQHVLSDEEFRNYMSKKFDVSLINDSMKLRDRIYSTSNADLTQGNLISVSPGQTLREQCEAGAKSLGIDISSGSYKERLDYELSIIEARKFEDYFFLVGDLMRHTRKHKLCGAGRGSSAGSLVCLLIGITTVDPLRFNLMFERFLSMDRIGELPDCDLDLSQDGRQLAFDYLKETYGINHVAQIGSTSLFKENAIFEELGKRFEIPKYECSAVIAGIEDYAQGDKAGAKLAIQNIFNGEKGRTFLAKYPEMEIATSLAAHPRHATRHAAGVIVTEKPINNYFGYDAKLGGLHANKEDVELLNHCKIDLLGLKQLSVFEMALELAGLPLSTFDNIDYEDAKVFAVLNDGKFAGVSQFQGYALKNLTKQVTITEFEDLVALTSLARPGPLDSGGASRWVECKNGRAVPSYIHPDLEPLLCETKGSIVFQEQLMRIVREIGGLDWVKVTKFRRAVSKSKGYEALREFEQEFGEGALSRGWTEEQAKRLWDELVTFGKYGFPRAHAVAYSINSYQCMWLKAYYPKEYAAAMLQYQDKKEKQLEILKELVNEGIDYISVDVENSTDKWRVVDKNGSKVLVGPLQNIHKIGLKSVQQILGARARGEPLPDSLQKKLTNAKTDLDSLNPIRDSIKSMNWKAHVNGPVTRLTDAVPGEEGEWREYTVIGLVSKVDDVDENDQRKQEDRKARGQAPVLPGDPRSWAIRLDSDEIKGYFCKVGAKKYAEFKDQVLTLVPGKSIVAVSGVCVPQIPCFMVNSISVVGEME